MFKNISKYKVIALNFEALKSFEKIKNASIHSLTPTEHSDESSGHDLIPTVETPVNVFRNQLILKIGDENSGQIRKPFENYTRYVITEPQYLESDIINIFKRYLNPYAINALFINEHIMGKVQQIYPQHFRDFRIRLTQKMV